MSGSMRNGDLPKLLRKTGESRQWIRGKKSSPSSSTVSLRVGEKREYGLIILLLIYFLLFEKNNLKNKRLRRLTNVLANEKWRPSKDTQNDW